RTAQAGDLEGIAQADAGMRAHRVVAEVEVGDELREGEDDGLERRVEVLDVGERVLDLKRVVQAHVELLPRAVHADGHLDLAIADDGRVCGWVHLDQERKDVELGPDEPGRSSFDEARLSELRLESL